MATPAPTSRTREAPQGDEEASSELKLGEFQDVDALTHSEAALVINALVSKRRGDRKNVNDTEYVSPCPLLRREGEKDSLHGSGSRGASGASFEKVIFMGASPQTPGLAALELEKGEELAEDAEGRGGDSVQHG
jgi:hypothetical protein